MKNKLKSVLIFMGIMLLSIGIMVGGAYLYLESVIKADKADVKEQNVPYCAPLPESAGVIVILPDNSAYLLYLGFSDDELLIAKTENYDISRNECYGYEVSYKISCNYTFVSEFIDRLGGIELYDSGETLRYTGVQITDKLYSVNDSENLKREVVKKIFEKISEISITKEDFYFIIQNTETDLTVPDCYYWPSYVTEIAAKARFIN